MSIETKMQRRFRECDERPPEWRPEYSAWYDQTVGARISAMVFYLRRHAEAARQAEKAIERETDDRKRRLAGYRLRDQRRCIRDLIDVIRRMERTGEVLA